MQIFEIIEISEYPYMITKQIYEGEKVIDVIDETKVFLLVDHNLNRIWTFNGFKSSYKQQIFGVRLAEMLRAQLQLKYTIFSLNKFAHDDERFKEVMDKSLGGGIAENIKTSDFMEFHDGFKVKADTTAIPDISITKAIEYVSDIPQPAEHLRRFLIIGGNVYTDEEFTEEFVNKQKSVKKPIKLGRLNRGFTGFLNNYSTRLIISDRQVQGIEIYIHKDEMSKVRKLETKIPLFYEDKFRKEGSIETLNNAFQIPDELLKEDK